MYTPGIDQYDASTGALHLMAEDALGTVRGFVNDNAAGAVTDTFGSFAFGAPRTRTGSDAFSLAWGGAGGYQTDANGLVLMGNRVYHVYTGRFLTRDPAGAGSNDYEYADDSPLNETDPSGLDPARINGSFGSVGGGDPGSWYLGDMFDSVYSPTGVNLTGKSVTGSTDYYLCEWLKAPGDILWSLVSSTYLFTQLSLSDLMSPTLGLISPSSASEHGWTLGLAGVGALGGALAYYAGKLAIKTALASAARTVTINIETQATKSLAWGLFSKTVVGTGTAEVEVGASAAEVSAAVAGGTLAAAGGLVVAAGGAAYIGYEVSYYTVNNTHYLDWAVNGLAGAMGK